MTNKRSTKRRKLMIGGPSSPAGTAEVIVNDEAILAEILLAEQIENSEDLLTEILLLLPAKSLIKFKLVSKKWLRLISDSYFSFNHARRNRSSLISGLYLYNPRSTNEQVNSVSLHGYPSLPTLAFLNCFGEETTTRVRSSCNGLLLCEIRRRIWHRYGSRFIVCNPTTQQYKLLPEFRGQSPPRSFHDEFPAYLAFDPSKSLDYKVLLVKKEKMDIYYSGSSSWKRIDFTEPYGGLRGVFCNGAIHWISFENVHIRFEVEAERLIETPMPPNPKILSHDKIRYFGESGGHLLLIQTHQRSAMKFKILEMDRDYRCWSVKCQVDLKPLISEFHGIDQRTNHYYFHVLSVVKEENENDFALVLLLPRPAKVISYNVKFKTKKVLRDLLPGEINECIHYHCPRAPFQFIESLSPV